ncbi:unnamed protein product [Closterium sp. NIES-65]|nr:unnamed protein product [Closterium sp. NIES-65]
MTLRGDGRRPDEKLQGDGRQPDEKLQGDGRRSDEKLQGDGRRPDEEKKLGTVPKPLEESAFSMECEEWPQGEEWLLPIFLKIQVRVSLVWVLWRRVGWERRRVKRLRRVRWQRRVSRGHLSRQREQRGLAGLGGEEEGGGDLGGGVAAGTMKWSQGMGRGKAIFKMHPRPHCPQTQCSQCMECLSAFVQHISCCALIANFAYRPIEALLNRFLAAFPPQAPEFDHLLKALLLRSPLNVEQMKSINVSAAAGMRRGVSGMRQRAEQVLWLPTNSGMRESVMRHKVQEMPVFFLLAVALYHAKAITRLIGPEEEVGESGAEEDLGNDKEGDGDVWQEVRSCASVSATKGSGPFAGGERACGVAGCGIVEGGGVKLRSCGGCGKVAYCSRECQKAHWPSHKLTCPGRTNGKKIGKDESKDGSGNSGTTISKVSGQGG